MIESSKFGVNIVNGEVIFWYTCYNGDRFNVPLTAEQAKRLGKNLFEAANYAEDWGGDK